jgi:hypothetical protein
MTRTLEELREYLVGEWKFDNNFLDSSGNGNHGTPTDIEWKPTARGLKPYFNNGGYIDCGSDSSLNLINQFTIFLYYNPFESSGNTPLISKFSGTDKEGYNVYVDDDERIHFYGNIGGVPGTFGSGFDIPDKTTWNMYAVTYDNSNLKIYSNGSLEKTVELTGNIQLNENVSLILGYNSSFYSATEYDKHIDNVYIYNTPLTDDEVLALYESTKHAYGVQPAERSFTHRLQPEVDANTVAAFDMSTKNSDGTLMDLSGNSNHGDIQGAVRAGGYFTDGMRFDGVDDFIKISNLPDMGYNDRIVEILCYIPSGGNDQRLYMDGAVTDSSSGCSIYVTTDALYTYFGDGVERTVNTDASFKRDCYNHVVFFCNRDSTMDLYVNGIKESSNDISLYSNAYISNSRIPTISGYANNVRSLQSNVIYATVLNAFEESQIQSRFNSLATLPLYTFNASKYPTSSGWTSNVPYSSMSISSGEFSFTDDGQLQCDSAGSFTLRNAHEFDGDEYIKVTIDGVEYAGTGSVTQGNVTVAITQSSTKIDVNMGTGDVIDGIDIQFREPVE